MLKMMMVKEIAEYLKTKPCTIYKLCKEKKIPHIRLASHIRFHKDVIDEWIRNKSNIKKIKFKLEESNGEEKKEEQ